MCVTIRSKYLFDHNRLFPRAKTIVIIKRTNLGQEGKESMCKKDKYVESGGGVKEGVNEGKWDYFSQKKTKRAKDQRNRPTNIKTHQRIELNAVIQSCIRFCKQREITRIQNPIKDKNDKST